MIATFVIEISLLLYVVIRYKMNTLTRIIGAVLLLLATFQYAEFHVCESVGVTSFYSRLGYIAITMLPPVGIHLVATIAKKNPKKLIAVSYATGITFALIFGFSQSAFNGYECAGNYAVFQLTPGLGRLYGVYYYALLFTGITLCVQYAKTASKTVRQALNMQAFGYISFMLPTGIVNLLNPTTLDGIPSIMCGFAVVYALILGFGIAPKILKEKSREEILSIK